VSIDVAQNNLNLVGRVLNQQPYQIMTTLTYRAGLVGSSGLVGKVEQLLEELQLEDVTILQAKPPKLFGSGLVSGLVECIDDGYAVHAGTMDVGAGKLKSLAQRLDERDEILVSNEFEFSLVNRKREKWFRICKNQGVIPLVRNVLGKDLLASGRWTSSDPLYKGTRKFSNKVLEKYEPLHSMLYRVLDKASARAGKAEHGPELKDYRARRYEEKRQSSVLVASQVAINYVVAKGGVPLVDVFDMESARELVGCLGWRLTDEEVKLLGQAAELSDM
jgi:aryl-alcohol dehydrogenase-like predicted oxidoreductase